MAINKRFASEEYVNENYAPISHPHSWADSGDKITYGDTLTWDGNTEGRNTFNNFYFVSSAVPTEADFSNGGTLTVFSDGDLESVEIGGSLGLVVWADVSEQFGTEAHALVVTTNGNMLVGVLPNGAELNGVVYEKGVYFQKPDDITYTTSLTINGYNGFPRTEITPLPTKYLPESHQFGTEIEQNVLFDGDVITDNDGFFNFNEPINIEAGINYIVVIDGKEYLSDTSFYDDTDYEYMFNVYTNGGESRDYVLCVYQSSGNIGNSSNTTHSLKVYTEKEVVTKIKEEYLPETINSIVFYVDDGRNTVTTDITYDKLLEIWVAGKVNLTNIIEIRINDYNEFGSRYYCKDITYTDNRQFIVTVDAPSVYGTIVLDETGIMFDAEA